MAISKQAGGWNWEALDDTASLLGLERLDDALLTDRRDDEEDYLALFGARVAEERPFINIGAGNWRHPFWRNHDFVQPPYDKFTPPDYNIDLSNSAAWPIDSETLIGAFTSHTIEHLTDEMVAHVFKEVNRTLRTGGVFRISTPDFHTAYAAWRLADRRYYHQRSTARAKSGRIVYVTSVGFAEGKAVSLKYLERFASCLGRVDTWRGLPVDEGLAMEHAGKRPEDAAECILEEADFSTKPANLHINYWTEEKLRRMLVDAGFRLVLRSSFGQCIFPLMRNKIYFDTTRPNESIWVDAVK